MKQENQSSLSSLQRLDMFFDKHPLTAGAYLAIGLAGSVGGSLLTSLLPDGISALLSALLFVAIIVWLAWLGPRYLRRYDRRLIAGLGTLAFFAPMIGYSLLLWLAQPGWPLDDLMGDKYSDFPAFLSTVIFTLVVYGLLLLRMKLYDALERKQRSKRHTAGKP